MLAACLIAAFAIAAVAASGASALEWAKCEAKAGGNYTESNCKTKAKPKGTGSFELLKASQVAEKRVAKGKSANVPFSGESVGGGGVLASKTRECTAKEERIRTTREHCEAEGGEEGNFGTITVECAKENNTGEAEGKNKIANVHVVFRGCVAAETIPCTSAGEEEGEIETSPLKGALGYINKSTKEVGVVLEPAKKHGRFAEFNCGGFLEINVGVGNSKEGAEYVKGTKYPEGCHGAHEPEGEISTEEGCPGATPTEESHGGDDQIISPITPVNKMTNEFTQQYTAENNFFEDKNIPDHLEGKHLSALEDYFVPSGIGSSSWTAASEVITNVNTPEEEGMIKA